MNLNIPDSIQHSPLIQQSSLSGQKFQSFAETVKRVALELDEEFQNIAPVIILSGVLMQIGWLHSIQDFEIYLLNVLKVLLPIHPKSPSCHNDHLTV